MARGPDPTRLSSCPHLRSDHISILDNIPLAVDCTQTVAGDPSNSVSFVIHSLFTSSIVKSDPVAGEETPRLPSALWAPGQTLIGPALQLNDFQQVSPKRFEPTGRLFYDTVWRLLFLSGKTATLCVRRLLQRREQRFGFAALVGVLVAGDDTLER